MPSAPSRITIRAYNVGFGDCLLLTFHYAARDRHVLIDFGTTRPPVAKKFKSDFMMEIAQDIKDVCGGKLDAVVATHRHRDHISGFTRSKSGKGTGDIIRDLKPDIVLQPWTEDPEAPEDALAPVNDPGKAAAGFRVALADMHAVAGDVASYSRRSWLGPQLRAQLAFLGEENLSNADAVKNLKSMGSKHVYGYFGSKSSLESVLPGVKVLVLGPPTLKQSESIRKQTDRNDNEFWQLYNSFTSFWGFQAAAGRNMSSGQLFPRVRKQKPDPTNRWFVDRLRAMQDDSILSIVRCLDDQMNNTSLILLFEAGGKRLLFPGDAQWENWSYALRTLEQKGRIELLKQVDFYKVGHHGSLNATPRSLWSKFSKKGASGRLKTVLSTRPGVHGLAARHTEVPRKTLVEELEAKSTLFRTDNIKASDGLLCRVIKIPLGR